VAMKKAEIEEHRARYEALMAEARSAERDGLYRRVIELTLSSLGSVDGMMQYERRYEGAELSSIEAVDLILKYAPLLLDADSLKQVEALLRDSRRVERHTSESLADMLSQARALMWDAHRLWDHLELHPEARQDELRRVLGGDQDQWRSVAEAWEKMGLLRRAPEGGSYRLALCTRMGGIVSAKCPACGSITEAPKAMFLEELTCPKCRTKALFVILVTKPTANREE
jgi:hypothetical protein